MFIRDGQTAHAGRQGLLVPGVGGRGLEGVLGCHESW